MKKFKKSMIAMLAIVAVATTTSTTVFAREVTSQEYELTNVQPGTFSEVIVIKDGNYTELAEKLGVSEASISNAKENMITFEQVGNEKVSSADTKGFVQLKNIDGPYEAWSVDHIHKQYLPSGGSWSRELSETKSFTTNNTVGMSASAVSIGLGFGSSTSYTIKDTISISNPTNAPGYVYVHVLYDTYTFDIIELGSGDKVGFGSAMRPVSLAPLASWDM